MESVFLALVVAIALLLLAAWVSVSAVLTFHGSWLGCAMMVLLLFGLLVLAAAGMNKKE